MIHYKRVDVTKPEQFQELYDDNAFTIEGLAEESLGDLLNWIKETAGFKRPIPNVYIIKGAEMNKQYHLTGKNKYNKDLNIVAVKLTSLNEENIGRLALARFAIGGRWFNDIVDNNARREH